ncbi:uncharacterized protein LOC124636640 [Helicoverpa zea]|uniref:uncharacterized protein LOC124636640 n=1 Tax=Helicoverpa zea TaxID=7113 RepID=UPI001F57D7D8|nr:uncharacterized protein LOC124636640 [Helicoverpa zea]
MLLKICYLLLVVNCFCSAVWDLNEVEIYGAGKAPFFEIPCMRIGGTCAQSFACPPGTKVGQRGLCPEQQRIGVECCRPREFLFMYAFFEIRSMQFGKGVMGCRTQMGECIPLSVTCPSYLLSEDATGCGYDEICCLRRGKSRLEKKP